MFLRKFIILNKQSERNLKGHVRLEARGVKSRIALAIEGKTKEEVTRRLFIVSNEKNKFKEVELGRVEVNKNGKGVFELVVNSNSVKNSQIPISDFNVLLLKEIDAKGNEKVVLAGYIYRDDNTIESIINKQKTNKVRLKSQNEEVEMAPIVKQARKVKVVEEAEKTEEVKKIQEVQEEKEVEETIESKQVEEEKLEVKNQVEKDKAETSIFNILKNFEETDPFKRKLARYRWWEIKNTNKDKLLPYHNYLNASQTKHKDKYTDCETQIEKYQKYLFGIAENKGKITHYIYGIPGRYERKEHPHGGATGFVSWIESKDKSGYWLLYINANTGKIVKPSKL